jgi:hypothetical protein
VKAEVEEAEIMTVTEVENMIEAEATNGMAAMKGIASNNRVVEYATIE